MNWYKKAQLKIATVTFQIEGSDRISQPMNKLNICHDLSKFIFYDIGIGKKIGMKWDDIDPDASDGNVFDPMGKISIYLRNPSIKEGIIKNIIDQYNEHKAGLIKLQFLGVNESGIDGVKTARILIFENRTQDLYNIPEMNISNSNAMALIRLFENEGMDGLDPTSGSLDISNLKSVINRIEQNDFVLDTYTQDPTVDKADNGPTIYDGGRSLEQFSEYLYILKEMISYMERNNLPNGQINYG